jgi:hypothetical protein
VGIPQLLSGACNAIFELILKAWFQLNVLCIDAPAVLLRRFLLQSHSLPGLRDSRSPASEGSNGVRINSSDRHYRPHPPSELARNGPVLSLGRPDAASARSSPHLGGRLPGSVETPAPPQKCGRRIEITQTSRPGALCSVWHASSIHGNMAELRVSRPEDAD